MRLLGPSTKKNAPKTPAPLGLAMPERPEGSGKPDRNTVGSPADPGREDLRRSGPRIRGHHPGRKGGRARCLPKAIAGRPAPGTAAITGFSIRVQGRRMKAIVRRAACRSRSAAGIVRLPGQAIGRPNPSKTAVGTGHDGDDANRIVESAAGK